MNELTGFTTVEFKTTVVKKNKKIKSLIGLKLIDRKKRSTLSEGRDYGFSSALAKNVNGDIETVCPVTACKDFLNDVIYTEITGKPYSIYGLKYSKQNIFSDGVGYLVFGIEKQGSFGSYDYPNYKRDLETLASNWKNLEKFINWFEKEFKLESLTKISQLGENRYLAVFPKFWAEGTYLISLYGLLMRTGFFYKEGEPMQFLKNFKYDTKDVYIINSALPKIELMLNGKIPKQDLNECGCPHSLGIVSYKF